MKTISEYRTAVLTVLGDPGGRRYSEEQIDLALKEALGKLGTFRPNRETVKVKIAELRGKEAVIKWVPDPSSDVLTVRDESGHWYCAADYRTGGRMYLQLYGDVFVAAAGDQSPAYHTGAGRGNIDDGPGVPFADGSGRGGGVRDADPGAECNRSVREASGGHRASDRTIGDPHRGISRGAGGSGFQGCDAPQSMACAGVLILNGSRHDDPVVTDIIKTVPLKNSMRRSGFGVNDAGQKIYGPFPDHAAVHSACLRPCTG